MGRICAVRPAAHPVPLLVGALLWGALGASAARAEAWPWLTAPHTGDTLDARLPPPEGFVRVPVEKGSFGEFVRGLPLLPEGAPVRAFDGKALTTPHVAVVDLDVGSADLQQCADSAMRLFAEYQWSRGAAEQIAFHTTSGDRVPFARYAGGERIAVRGNHVGWQKSAAKPPKGKADRDAFRRFLDDVFMYAGSRSLAQDTVAVEGELAPGDLLVVGGSPGHVLVILDVAVRGDVRSDERRYLIGEGFMPAQSFHVVPARDGARWLSPGADGALRVPTWTAPFPRSSARRFPGG